MSDSYLLGDAHSWSSNSLPRVASVLVLNFEMLIKHLFKRLASTGSTFGELTETASNDFVEQLSCSCRAKDRLDSVVSVETQDHSMRFRMPCGVTRGGSAYAT